MPSSNNSNKSTRDELEKLHDECKDGNHKWEEEKLTVCSVCGMFQDEYNDRNRK